MTIILEATTRMNSVLAVPHPVVSAQAHTPPQTATTAKTTTCPIVVATDMLLPTSHATLTASTATLPTRTSTFPTLTLTPTLLPLPLPAHPTSATTVITPTLPPPPPPTFDNGIRPPTCFYTVLDIPRLASDAEIKKAYRKMSMRYHPDRAVGLGLDRATATAKMAEVNQANDVLTDEVKRRHYDLTGCVKPLFG